MDPIDVIGLVIAIGLAVFVIGCGFLLLVVTRAAKRSDEARLNFAPDPSSDRMWRELDRTAR